MTETIRERIIANVKATLEGIQEELGYFNTVVPDLVKRTMGGVGTISEFPTLLLNVGSEQGVTRVHDYTTATLNITIEAWIRADKVDMPTAIERMLGDLKAVMQKDYTRGGLAMQTDYIGCTEPAITDAETMLGVIGVQFALLYRTRRENPKAL